jgi:outer membrane protein assembly factor BamB
MLTARSHSIVTALGLLLVTTSGCKMNPQKSQWRTGTEAPLNARLALAGDALVVTNFGPARSDRLSSFALADGAERWQVPLEDFLLGSAVGGVHITAAPDGAAVYLAQDSMVASFAAATGDKRWATQVPAAEPFESFTVPHRPAFSDHRLLLLSRRSRVVALDRRDGKLLFRTDDHDPAVDLVVRGGAVITRSLEAHDVRAHDVTSGQPLWTRAMSGPFATTARLATSIELASRRPDDGLYLVIDAERALLALEARTGAVRWELPVTGLASFAFAGSRLVVADSASVRGVDPASGEVGWQQATGGLSLVAPLDAGSVLLHLAAATCTVDVATGAIREHARYTLSEQDRVLDAGPAGVVMTTDNGIARLFWRDGDKLAEMTIGETTARPGAPAAHGVEQAILTSDGVVTFNTAHEIERFAK